MKKFVALVVFIAIIAAVFLMTAPPVTAGVPGFIGPPAHETQIAQPTATPTAPAETPKATQPISQPTATPDEPPKATQPISQP